ncbi:heat shock protein beta-2-like [Patiria miniata]|uniref:SHSP domain-containing protein n=1 Tax=Patiria miniata TaxID=46514 RepID=A0A913Z544_PATMI|nr:heat shock protein beta-2-like [Patiria miniata]
MNIEIKIPLTHPRVEYSITGGDGASNPIIVSSVPAASSKQMITRQVYTTGSPQQTTVESATMRTSSGRRVEVNVQPSAPTKPTLYQGYYVTSPQPTIISSPTESSPPTPSASSQPNFTTKIVSSPSSGPPEPARQSSRVECDEHRFTVTLDVSQYRPEDVEVKVKDNKLTVHAEQREGHTATGYVQREYYRQYTLPEDVDISLVKCYLSEKKVLTVEIPRVPLTDTRERQIPIMMIDGNQNATRGGKRTYFVEEMNTSDADSFRK